MLGLHTSIFYTRAQDINNDGNARSFTFHKPIPPLLINQLHVICDQI